MKGKFGKICLVAILTIIVITSFFASYAYQNQTKEPEDKNASLVLADENFSINYKDGNYFEVNQLAHNETIIKHLTITNVLDAPNYISIALMDINKKSDNISVKLLDVAGNVIYEDTLGNMDTELLKNKEIAPRQTLTFDIVITNQDEDLLTGFSANIMAYKSINLKEDKTLKDAILRDNEIQNMDSHELAIDYSTNGLFTVLDDNGTNYIFRGNVSNNYIELNGILFRILRINSDNSVRLITDSSILESAYISKISYQNYEQNVLLSASLLPEKLQSWYNSNLLSLDNFIVNSTFCSENAFYLENNDGRFFNAYQRIVNSITPTLNCTGTAENAKIGIITADEALLAGANLNGDNLDYFLYNPEETKGFFTSTGSKVIYNYNVVDNFAVTNTGKLDSEAKVTTSLGIRPVISLDKNVTITGLGTKANPYKINKQ